MSPRIRAYILTRCGLTRRKLVYRVIHRYNFWFSWGFFSSANWVQILKQVFWIFFFLFAEKSARKLPDHSGKSTKLCQSFQRVSLYFLWFSLLPRFCAFRFLYQQYYLLGKCAAKLNFSCNNVFAWIFFRQRIELKCEVDGSPPPRIYWVTGENPGRKVSNTQLLFVIPTMK